MKRFSWILQLCMMVLLCRTAAADTTWVDTGNVSGFWASTGSPYVIRSGNVTVAQGDSLTIGRGVQVIFSGPYQMQVHGVLIGSGRSDDSIRFTTDTLANPDRWRGIFAQSAVCSLRYCVIENALAAAGEPGAGIRAEGGRLYLNGCSLRRNRTTGEGGAIYCSYPIYAQVTNCRLIGNQAGEGGAISSRGGSPNILSCNISGNLASNQGGGILAVHSGMTVYSTLLKDNLALTGNGGGVATDSSYFRLLNCILLRNRASGLGGGLYCRADSNSVVGYCDFISDSAQAGGGIFNVHTAVTVWSSIVAHTTGGSGISFTTARSASVATSDFFSNAGGDFSGDLPVGIGQSDNRNARGNLCDRSYNFRLNPQFADLANGDFHLLAASPCISAGQISSVTTDYDYTVRPQPAGSQPDVGAFESPEGGGYLFLAGRMRGTLAAGEYVAGLDLRVDAADSLILLPGTRLKFLRGTSMTVYGRLRAIGTEDDSIVFTRMFDADSLNWAGLYFITSSDSCRLSYGLVEHATGKGTDFPGAGGGITCVTASPNLDHCTVQYCVASSGANMGTGSGLGCYTNSHPTVVACRIHHNGLRPDQSYANSGGGVYCRLSSPQLYFCRIDSNASSTGGGVSAQTSDMRLEGCRIDHNLGHLGGAFYAWHGAPTVASCVLDNNRSDSGAVYISASTTHLNSSSLVSNTGGVVCSAATLMMRNVVVANSSIGPGFYFYRDSQNSQIAYCDVFGNAGGAVRYADDNAGFGPPGFARLMTTNINSDSCDRTYNVLANPLLVNPAAEDYHLQTASPCINAGDPAFPRDPDGTYSDIGVYWHVASPRPVAPFDLWSPGDGWIVRSDSIWFGWHGTQDPDSGETITYQLHLSAGDLDTAFSVQTDTVRMVNLLQLGFHETTTIFWWVDAHSLYPDSTVRSQSTRSFTFQRPIGPAAPFDLILPAQNDTARADSIRFVWHSTQDPDSGDVITYRLHLSGGSLDTTLSAQSDTVRVVYPLTLGFRDSTQLTWSVTAHSLYPDSSVASLSTRHLYFQRRITAVHLEVATLPSQFALQENYPNPFNAQTTIRFDLPKSSAVRLELFDMLGRSVAVLMDEQRAGGSYAVRFDGANFASGVYLYRLDAGDFHAVRKMILLK